MRKTLTLASLLLSAVWLQAQTANPSSDKNKTSGPATIEGCLQSAGGEFTLTESNGTVHQLSGSGNKLNHQVGHEVQITGKASTKTTADTSYGAASSAQVVPVFEVKTVTQVADTCKSPGK